MTLVLAGKNCSGKSTIANMLVQGNMFSKNRIELHGCKSHKLHVDVVDGRQWSVCDITGLGFLKSNKTEDEIVAQRMLSQVSREGGKEKGFNIVAFVIKKDEVARKEEHTIMLWESFKSLFEGVERNFVIIITHFDDSLPDQWIRENKRMLQQIYGDKVPFIACDFKFLLVDPSMQHKDREEALKVFEAELKRYSKSPLEPGLIGSKSDFWKYSKPEPIPDNLPDEDDVEE
ncbi:hypothetical protein BGZ79_004802 [Entomortierella chlamydospora]|nr:hypothetical protein BGZ79_004802 [Entomortierella chlamydospora]